MHTSKDFFQKTEWLKEQNITVSPLYDTDELLSVEELIKMKDADCGLRTGNLELIQICAEQGFTQEQLFFRCHSHAEADLDNIWGKCFFVAECKDDITLLDKAAEKHLAPGYLETISITLSEHLKEGEGLSRQIRFSRCLAVRGIFMTCHTSRQAKENFSLMKKIRSDMPCLFTYFSFDGLLTPLSDGDEELLQTVKMLASLNDTSFYARFFIG